MNRPATIESVLSNAARILSAVSESPRLDAEVLLAWTLHAPRTYLFTHPEEELQDRPASEFSVALARRKNGEPIAYITGSKEFWSMEFKVSPDTLVPRPETETLVEQALALIPQDAPCRVLDLGTGSGAIAAAIASERPKSTVDAVDSSSAALMIAKQNAALHGIQNIEFLQGSWTAPVADRTFDVIVSNPPYVADGDPALEDLKHEPISALTAGPDGLAAIRKIAREAKSVIEANGSILFEHGIEQQDSVAAVLQEHGWTDIACFRDLAGQPRVTTAKMSTSPPKDQP
jgi:release factor glutamine methyltransferase